jgi:hypothetical protein
MPLRLVIDVNLVPPPQSSFRQVRGPDRSLYPKKKAAFTQRRKDAKISQSVSGAMPFT